MCQDNPQDKQQAGRGTPDASGVVPLAYESRLSTGESYRRLAIAALIFGILLPPVGFFLGRAALNGMRKSGNRDGRGMALVGYILGLIGLIVLILCVLVFIVCLVIVNTH